MRTASPARHRRSGRAGERGRHDVRGTVIEADTDWVYRDETVTFWAYSTDDPAPTFSSIQWDFDYDGLSFDPAPGASGEEATHTFTANGTYRVAAALTSATGTEFAELTVEVHHLAPIVTPPEDLYLTAGAVRTLTVTAETEAEIQSVEWWVSFNGEEYTQPQSLGGLTPNFEFKTFGTYEFWVAVEDVDGEVGEAAFTAYVDEATQTGQVTVSGPVDEEGTVWFTVMSSIGHARPCQRVRRLDWIGEFDLVDVTEGWEGVYLNNEATFWHTYDDGPVDNVYHAKVRLQNEGGESDLLSVDVTVRDVAPTVLLGAGRKLMDGAGTADLGRPDFPARRVTDVAYSKQDVWELYESVPVGFFALQEPSARDRASQRYFFSVVKDSAEGTGPVPAADPVESKDPWIKLPSYEVGEVYVITGYLTDKDGKQTTPQTIYAVMSGGVDGTATGSGVVKSAVYGSMKRPGQSLDGLFAGARYNRYGYAPEIEGSLAVGESMTVELVPDRHAQEWVQAGYRIQYVFNVHEEHFGTWGVTHENLDTVYQDHGTFTLPFVYPKDYRITVTGGFQVVPNPERPELPPPPSTATYYQVVAKTPPTTTWLQDIEELWEAAKGVAQQLGEHASTVLDILTSSRRGAFVDTLVNGFTAAATQIEGELGSTLKSAFYKWFGLTDPDITLPGDFTGPAITDFALQYAGLTWKNISNILIRQLGEGNVAALNGVASWLGNFGDEDLGTAGASRKLIEELQRHVTEISFGDLENEVLEALRKGIENGIAKAIPQLIAKVVPITGGPMSIIKGIGWLIQNQGRLRELFTEFNDHGIPALIAGANGIAGAQDEFTAAIVKGFKGVIDVGLSALASQIGLGSLPNDIKKAMASIPKKVDEKLTKAIRELAKGSLRNGGPVGRKTDGLLNGTTPVAVSYGSKSYKLFATKESGAQHFIKLTEEGGAGKTIVLKTESFVQSAQDEFSAAFNMAGALAQVKKNGSATKPPSYYKTEGARQDSFAGVMNALKTEIENGNCLAVGGGCFAAGTKLWTPEGYRNVEELRLGDFVFSRDQYRPDGAVESKPVEKVFVRLTEVVHLHVGGQVVRTTGEHPFYAYDRGWVPVSELADGDSILTAAGDWKAVEEVFATGELETVYNLRVADHHTYFVGGDGWGWAAWAHNDYTLTPRTAARFKDLETDRETIRGEKLNVRETTTSPRSSEVDDGD